MMNGYGICQLKKKLCICFFIGVFFSITDGHTADLKVVILDVGMGQSVLLVQGGHGLLIDTGLVEYGPHVLSRMNFYGIQTLDYLVLSHLHPDHAGGYFQFREAWPDTSVFENCHIPEKLHPDEEDFFVKVHTALAQDSLRSCLAAGDIVFWQGHELQVLWPVVTEGTNINHNSLVVLLKVGQKGSLLVMGDVDKTVENRLKTTLQSLLSPSGVTLYVAAHHAAVDTGDPGFLSVLRPQVSIISVGQNNPFGYPSDTSVSVLERYSGTVLRTDRDGEICFTLDSTTAIPCKLQSER